MEVRVNPLTMQEWSATRILCIQSCSNLGLPLPVAFELLHRQHAAYGVSTPRKLVIIYASQTTWRDDICILMDCGHGAFERCPV